MINHFKKFIGLVTMLPLMLVCSDAFAGSAVGTITYSPYAAQSIPTLSTAMLWVLAFLFVVLAFRALRSHPAGKILAVLVVAGVLALAAAPGNKLIREAQALIGYVFSNPGGGVVTIGVTSETPVQNTSGREQQITGVNPTSPYTALPTSGSPQCTIGLVVPNNNSCYVWFGLAPE